jgi:protein SCO1
MKYCLQKNPGSMLLILWILTLSFFLGLPAAAEEASQHMMHHDPAKMEKAPAPESHETMHVHPEPPADMGDKVGLKEKLGQSIPLDLRFTDATGETVTLRDLVTVPTIIAPVYYHCPNVCNFLQSGLAEVLRDVKLEPGKEFRVISVSFDETETAESARRSRTIYMTAMNNEFPEEAWSFLTGDLHTIHQLTDAVGYSFMRQGKDFLHPVAICIVSPEGKIARYLYGTSYLPMDLTLALMEAAEGKEGRTIRKLVSFCFSFDPEQKTYVFNLLRISATVILVTLGGLLAFLILTGRKKK